MAIIKDVEINEIMGLFPESCPPAIATIRYDAYKIKKQKDARDNAINKIVSLGFKAIGIISPAISFVAIITDLIRTI